MTGLGRVVGLAVALITAAFMTVSGESFSAAHCEANVAWNQQASSPSTPCSARIETIPLFFSPALAVSTFLGTMPRPCRI